jgi:hypothetical protein
LTRARSSPTSDSVGCSAATAAWPDGQHRRDKPGLRPPIKATRLRPRPQPVRAHHSTAASNGWIRPRIASADFSDRTR